MPANQQDACAWVGIGQSWLRVDPAPDSTVSAAPNCPTLESSCLLQTEPRAIDGVLARGERELWNAIHPDPYIGVAQHTSQTCRSASGGRGLHAVSEHTRCQRVF